MKLALLILATIPLTSALGVATQALPERESPPVERSTPDSIPDLPENKSPGPPKPEKFLISYDLALATRDAGAKGLSSGPKGPGGPPTNGQESAAGLATKSSTSGKQGTKPESDAKTDKSSGTGAGTNTYTNTSTEGEVAIEVKPTASKRLKKAPTTGAIGTVGAKPKDTQDVSNDPEKDAFLKQFMKKDEASKPKP